MPKLKVYKLFISHAWDYNEEYARIIDLMNEAPLFRYYNYSVLGHDPLLNGKFLEALYGQIRPTNIVLILSGMYVEHSDWIQAEIDIASELGKPIIGIMPRGNIRAPQAVQEIAKEIINWNTSSVADAIRRHSS